MNRRDLYDLARRHASQSTDPDPHAITSLVLGDIGHADRLAALRISLPLLVKRVIAQAAARSAGVPDSADPTPATARPDLMLRQQVCTSAREWKQLADCSSSDLAGMAVFRRSVEAQHALIASQYERLAEAIDAAGVQTVGEVSRQVLNAVLT